MLFVHYPARKRRREWQVRRRISARKVFELKVKGRSLWRPRVEMRAAEMRFEEAALTLDPGVLPQKHGDMNNDGQSMP